jgi:hypothetical protein
MTRPSFATAWAAAMRIYEPATTGATIAKIIGGTVARNITNPDPQQRWVNTCAVRMSYVLNQSGVIVPRLPRRTVSGADEKWHFYRVKDLIEFLRQRWGPPEVVPFPPAGGGTLANKKGVVLFEVSGWSTANGHAALWNGCNCYDQCYFNQRESTYRTTRANFWSLS